MLSLVLHRFLLSTAVLVCGTLSQAQIDSAYILMVDRRVQAINAEKDYEVRTLENDEFLEYTTDGGGELKGFVKDGELVKIVRWIGLSSCVIITEYYFDRSQLIFVREQGLEFAYVDSTASFDPAVQNITTEGRYYFRDGVAGPIVQKGSTRCGGAPSEERSARLSAGGKRLWNLLMR